jgi:hypothetical protein
MRKKKYRTEFFSTTKSNISLIYELCNAKFLIKLNNPPIVFSENMIKCKPVREV